MKIALIGYGKMGHMIADIARSRGHEIISIIDVNNQQDFNSEDFKSAEVAIEFTAPTVAYNNVKKAFLAGVKVVSGSTGWMNEHEEEMKQLCQGGKNTLLWSSNFSLGVAVFSAVNKYLADIMNKYAMYDVDMTETHHVHKLDAPSGTAITLAQQIIDSIDRKETWVKETASQSEEIPIKSIREGEVPGIHTIHYESEADEIIITHSAKSRKGFALGAVLAAEFLAEHKGFLTINDLFKF